MNIYVPHDRNVAPSGLDNVYGMDMYLDEMEDFVESFLNIHKDGNFVCNNPLLLDYFPKEYLVYIDEKGNKQKFDEGKASEWYINKAKPKKLGSEH